MYNDVTTRSNGICVKRMSCALALTSPCPWFNSWPGSRVSWLRTSVCTYVNTYKTHEYFTWLSEYLPSKSDSVPIPSDREVCSPGSSGLYCQRKIDGSNYNSNVSRNLKFCVDGWMLFILTFSLLFRLGVLNQILLEAVLFYLMIGLQPFCRNSFNL
jgi:hypothetical protein